MLNHKLFFLLFITVISMMSCETDNCNQQLTYEKATAIYENLEELRQLPLVSPAREIDNAGKIYVGDNYLLIGEESQGIHVIKNTTGRQPSFSSFLNLPHTFEFVVENDIIYANSHFDLVTIDIKNLEQPKVITRIDNILNSSLINDEGEFLVGFNYERVTEELPCTSSINPEVVNFFDWQNELIPISNIPSSFSGTSNGSGTTNRMAKHKDHIYLIDDNDLSIVDISGDGKLENRINKFDRNMETAIIHEGRLFVGKTNGLSIVDISQPSNPFILKKYRHDYSCDPVLPYKDFAYVTLRSLGCSGNTNQMDVVDVDLESSGDLKNIKEIEMESPYGMTIVEDVLFVCEGPSGLKAFNIKDPSDPKLIVWDQDIEAYDVQLHPTKNILLIAGPQGLIQYEKEDVLSLTYLSSINY